MLGRNGAWHRVGHDDIDIEPHQFRRQGRQLVIPSLGPAELDHNILSFRVAESTQPSAKGIQARGMPGRGGKTQIPDTGDLRWLLRARRERPRGRRTADERDDFATPHSITSSARAMNASEIGSPIALAVLRLTTNSNLVGCSTGKSAVLAPFAILSTYSAARRNMAGKLTLYESKPPASTHSRKPNIDAI